MVSKWKLRKLRRMYFKLWKVGLIDYKTYLQKVRELGKVRA